VRFGALAAALLTALGVLLTGDALRQPLIDVFQRVSPARDPSPRVQVVAVDAASLDALGGWPWSRYTLARLTEQIADRGAAAIGFDFLFPEPDRQNPESFAALYRELTPATAAEIAALPSMDAVFARVIGRAPVILARAGVDGGALGHGLANGPPDIDGVIRRVPLLGVAASAMTPSLALDMVRVAEGASTIRLLGDTGGLTAVQVGARKVAVDPGGRVEIRYAAAPGSQRLAAHRVWSAADLLRQGVPADAFKDSLVLVGLTAAGTSDVVTTPREAETYGVFVQAQAIDAILSGRALSRPAWIPALEWGLGLTLVIVSWLGVPRAPMGLVLAGAGVETAAVLGGCWAAFLNNIVIDPYPMLAPGAAASAVTVAMLFVEGRRVQARLRAALDEERLTAARVSGELAAASEIQSGMLLPRGELARVSPDVEIDAVLQSAKTVGGDLYDAFLFGDGRVCFLVGDVTGKGVPASLFMALAKALSRSLLMRPATPLAAAIAEINAELSRDNRQAMAVSVLVGVLHPDDGTLHLCSAGHENPLVVDAEGHVREIVLDGGPPLCVDETFAYPDETHHLAPGERLVFFTDGLTEAQDPDGRLMERDALLAAVSMAARETTSAGELLDRLVAAVRAFEAGAEPSDDLTLLAVRRRAAT
jgi:serine phosphatase RsbU (regulator of sigma subunit)/CHASE2 domain-containing sensor protein